ncbi:cholesterol 25-hydroxylase-like protein 2 [Corythoichthys intestinalis]|uniref:cholesterol 25-hydroxylase-like protein 2 n=1 Tax=Corythoichthys intestinalis TaxID=161448 RepID=UPI0025A53E0A|nr:cholesterol 25-hydroxylase-like protein 2 [Corythoichthys intestinalis]XP_061800554.1 cholesterol 25-hydroxylase-like protein 2 [Nerophis lumbriciformis]
MFFSAEAASSSMSRNVTEGPNGSGLVLQPIWDYLRQNHHDLLRSPLFPVVLSVSTYFLLVGIYTTLDLLAAARPGINCYRLHPDRPVTWPGIETTLGVTIYNHLLYVFPAAVAQWLWRPPTPLPQQAPTLWEFCLGILGCLVVFDFQYYLWHLLHHRVPWLYRTFHAVHHEYRRPFSLVTQYLSGWELVSVGLWATVDPVLLRCHCLTTWGFMVFNVYVSTEDHCGYDFPWSMHNLVPFGLWGGAPKHDAHHRWPTTNFAPFFSHWDRLGGTHMVPPIHEHGSGTVSKD